MFKYCITVCLLAAIAKVHCDVSASVNKQACIRESSVNPGYVERAENGEVNDARSLKCYFKCYYENAGIMNANGEIQAEKLRENIPTGISKSMANRAIDMCAVRKGKDPKDACETAYLVQKCLVENNLHY